jgi:hypothetical protein
VLRDFPRTLKQAVYQDLHAVRAHGVVGPAGSKSSMRPHCTSTTLSSAFSRLNCIVLKRQSTLLMHYSQSECVFRGDAVSASL